MAIPRYRREKISLAHCKSPINVPPISKVRKHTTCLTLNPSLTCMQQSMSSWNMFSCVTPVSVDSFPHEPNELKIYIFTCHTLSQSLCIDTVTRQTKSCSSIVSFNSTSYAFDHFKILFLRNLHLISALLFDLPQEIVY